MFTHESVGTENVADSASYEENGKTCAVSLDVDYPAGGDPLMVRGVKQWMGGLLGLTDTTAMAGPAKFAEAFFKKNEPGREMLKNHPEGYRYELTVRKAVEAKAYVTFVIDTRTADGASVAFVCRGATFVKPTAKVFGYDMFAEENARSLAVLLTKGLQRFFEAEDFASLTREVPSELFSPTDQGVNVLPQADPWIEDGDVVFQYAQGELQGATASSPQVRVPLREARPLFSPDFKRALQEAEK